METDNPKISIAAVSYINTLPFIYGLEQYEPLKGKITLKLVPPAGCAEAWHSGDADIALVPVGAMERADIESLCCNWCLGAEGPVESVLLFSDTPLEELKVIYTDLESRTSVLMTKMLARFRWDITPQFIDLKYRKDLSMASGEAMLLIGDKTFDMAHRFRKVTDLAEEWIQMTGLPAVFACWIARQEVTPAMKTLFDRALNWGVDHLHEAIAAKGISGEEALKVGRYLEQCISYTFDQRKMEAVQKFFDYKSKLR